VPRKSTGTIYRQGETWVVRVSLGKARPVYPLMRCGTEEQAEERGRLVADTAGRLRRAGHEAIAPTLLARLAAASHGKEFDTVTIAIARVLSGDVVAPPRGATTFQEFAEDWTSGKLHDRYPDHVKRKGTAEDDAGRLRKHVYGIVGHVALQDFRLEHAQAVMAALSKKLSATSRRHVAQLIRRVLELAVFPACVIKTQPLPRGFLPAVSDAKAKAYLYPEEDARLLACTDVPLASRMFYGFDSREGMRLSEAEGLTWGDLDLERGGVTLDVNKTDQPRAWALNPGVATAFSRWWTLLGRPGPGVRVFDVETMNAARGLRGHLKTAGVTRAVLFERSETRQPIRVHDLRATFVTVSLANGKTETWVMDRTGHTSSVMINRYRRAARSLAELGVGDFVSMVDAVPELRLRLLAQSSAESSEPRIEPSDATAPGLTNPSLDEAGTRGRGRTGTPSLTADFESEQRVATGAYPHDPGLQDGQDHTVRDGRDASLTIQGVRTRVLEELERLADLALRAGDRTTERALRAAISDVANGRVEAP
jgi:integrase